MAPEHPKRAYRMVARAAAAAQTRERILDAVVALARERFVDDIALSDIATAAGVTVQTVLRHFDGREALLGAAARRGEEAVEGPRRRVTPGDGDEAAQRAVADYERFGDALMLWLAQEERSSFIRPLVERGRSLHQAWIDAVFAPQLSGRRGPSRARLRAQLIAVTDVYTWKLLRRDLGLSRRETERAIAGLVRGALGDHDGDTEER
jgi:AcrR family transcriptional regulator